MNKYVKKIIKKSLPGRVIEIFKIIFDWHSIKSYSQEGEDMILRRLFENKNKGFYVDIGAHHPLRFSNTYFFYKQGWRGINIDAMPGSMRIFRKLRPRDINIEIPVSLENKLMKYYIFNDPALNGFDVQLAMRRDADKNEYKIQKIVELQTQPLSDVLSNHLPKNQKIDFLSVDVEGLDFEVLKSNDWSKFKPEVVLAETLGGSSLSELSNHEISIFLRGVGYEIYAKAVNTVIYKRL